MMCNVFFFFILCLVAIFFFLSVGSSLKLRLTSTFSSSSHCNVGHTFVSVWFFFSLLLFMEIILKQMLSTFLTTSLIHANIGIIRRLNVNFKCFQGCN